LVLGINGIWSYMSFWEHAIGGKQYTQIISSKDLVADILPPPEYVLEAYLTSMQIADARDKGMLPPLLAHFGKLRNEFEERHQYWNSVPLDDEIRGVFLDRSYKAASAFFIVVTAEVIPARQTGDQVKVEQGMAEAGRLYNLHRGYIDQTVKLADRHAAAVEERVSASLATAYLITVTLVVLTLGGMALTVWRINTSIAEPIRQSVEVVECLASGNLSTTITVQGKDEFTLLLAALQELQSGFTDIVMKIRSSAAGVSSSSAEIAQANTDLSNRTEQQAASLEEVASTLEEIDAAVKTNTDGVRQAHQLALQTAEVASRAGGAVDQVVATMREINASSSRIADIISVIEGISFQTNILALNAAIEAARAGEHGRGFAVVASEVRSLAQSAADAAKEIEGLINASVRLVGQGAQQADGAGSTMQEVVSSIHQLTTIMSELSTANIEQSTGITQVDGSIAQIDRTTQENAGLAEEMAASSAVLHSQAAGLVEMVARFNVQGTESALPDASH
jgi:methyl-accepting chemotaxis protein